jgi:hypothetical protein
VGRDQSNLAKLRDAARVAENLGNDTKVYLDKAAHLAAIHKLPSRSRSPCNARTVTSYRWDKFWDMSQDWRKSSPWHSKKVIHCRLTIWRTVGGIAV